MKHSNFSSRKQGTQRPTIAMRSLHLRQVVCVGVAGLGFAGGVASCVEQQSDVVATSATSAALTVAGDYPIYTSPYDKQWIGGAADAHETLAYALSIAIEESDQFKNLLIQAMDQDDIRFREVDLFSILEEPIGLGTVRSYLNGLLHQLTAYRGVGDPVGFILALDPLASFKIPDKFLRSAEDDLDAALPVLVQQASGEGAWLFSSGRVLDVAEFGATDILGYAIRTNPFEYLVDPATGIDTYGVSFKTRFGLEFDECAPLQQWIGAKSPMPGMPGVVLVHTIEDIRDVYTAECAPTDPPSPPSPPPPPPEPDCPMGQLYAAQDKKSATRLASLSLESEAVFGFIDNQPCPGGEPDFAFSLHWIHALDGAVAPVQSKLFVFLRNEMHTPGVPKYKTKTIYTGWGLWPFKKVQLLDGWIEPPQLRILSLPGYPVFSQTIDGNNWIPENQGRTYAIDISEIDSKTCTQSATSSFTASVSFSFSLGSLVKTPFSVNWGVSETHAKSFTVGGISKVDLGNAIFEYCQPLTQCYALPGMPTRCSMSRSTGSATIGNAIIGI
ncbi:MAG: hypothetical protein IPL79_14900 [Myxococcales bacterium]|nr:hypothetical protein [Myxococcales bacterium]